jgi:hypothetical protein
MFRDDDDEAADDAVLFWAERSAAYYWVPFLIGALTILPFAPLDPMMAACGLSLAALACAWSRRSFIFHLRPTHIAVRGAALDPIYKVAWDDVREAQLVRAKQPWLGNGLSGEVKLVLTDDTRIRIPGVRDPATAAEAVNAIVARRAAAREAARRAYAA